MPITYVKQSTDSGLAVGDVYTKDLLQETYGTQVTQNISVGAGLSVTGKHVAQEGDPGVGGAVGDFTVEVNVVTGSTDIQISVRLQRLDGLLGTVNAQTAFSAEQVANAGVLTFNFAGVDLGPWGTGDRFAVQVQYRNTHSHTTRAIDMGWNTASSEVIAPWGVVLVPVDGVVSSVSDASALLSVTRGVAGSVDAASAASADLNRKVPLDGSADTASSASASLRADFSLAGSGVSAVDSVVEVSVERFISTSVDSASSASVALDAARSIASSADSSSVASVDARVDYALFSSVDVSATATSDFSTPSGGAGPPESLVATAVSDDQIDLVWDTVLGALGYDVERDGAVIARDVGTNSFSDTGLDEATEHTYRVRAVVG